MEFNGMEWRFEWWMVNGKSGVMEEWGKDEEEGILDNAHTCMYIEYFSGLLVREIIDRGSLFWKGAFSYISRGNYLYFQM